MELSMMTFMLEFPVLYFKPGTQAEKAKEIKLSCVVCMDAAGNIDSAEDLVDTCEYLGCRKIMLVPGVPTEDRKERVYDMFVKRVKSDE